MSLEVIFLRLIYLCLRVRDYFFNPLAVGFILLSVYPDYILSNIITFLTEDLKYSFSTAATIVNMQDGAAGIFGIAGAVIVDAYLTHYSMITLCSLLYLVGFVYIYLFSFHWSATEGNYVLNDLFVLVGLSFIAMGHLSLDNSSEAFAHESSAIKPGGIKFSVKFLIVLIYAFVEDKPNFAFFASIICIGIVTLSSFCYFIFLVSRPNHLVKKLTKRPGTPLGHVPRVLVAAFLNRRLHCPPDPSTLYQENTKYNLSHTDSPRLRWLDKAAITEHFQPEEERSKWRLCTVTEVEETKRLLRMVPMCTTFLAYGMVKSIGNTFFLKQGNSMDLNFKLGGLEIEIPLQAFFVVADIASAGTKILYKQLLSNRISGAGRKYGPPIKYAIGMIFSTFCCTVSSWVAAEVFRLKKAGHRRLSIFWLTPQFILFGAMDELTQEGIQEFFSHQLPPSMLRYDSVFTDGMIGAGAIFCTVLVLLSRGFTGWFPEDKVRASYRMDRFYQLLTGVCFIILGFYAFVATRFRYQENEQIQQEEDERDLLSTMFDNALDLIPEASSGRRN